MSYPDTVIDTNISRELILEKLQDIINLAREGRIDAFAMAMHLNIKSPALPKTFLFSFEASKENLLAISSGLDYLKHNINEKILGS